jgi:hypothetical protein|tara:strand:+ start:790 stop:972 length:183 start_codon:yes stop_codon:yes gene_type:complete
MYTHQIHIRLDAETFDALREEAERQERSMTAQTRKILRTKLIDERQDERVRRFVSGSKYE